MNSALFSVKRSAIRVYSRLAKETPGCISLTLGEPDFDTPGIIRKAAADSLESGDTHYIPNNGTAELCKAIADFEKERNGMDYTPDEVIVTVGATEAIFTSLFGILNPGDEVIVPTPAFGLYEAAVALCRGRFVPLDTSKNGFQISKEALKNAVTEKTKAIILNSPNNPTGCVLSPESLQNVREAVSGKGIFVICDDVYRQLIYGREYTSFASFRELRKQIIVIQSFSKPYAMTGWRAGYMLCDGEIKRQLEKVHQYTVVSACSFSQKACIKALETDVSPMLAVYEKRRNFVLSRLAEIGLSFVVPEGGFYVFPSIEKFGLTSDEFCRRMINEAGLAATPGACFGCGGNIRLTYCYADEELEEGLLRLEKFVKKLENEKK